MIHTTLEKFIKYSDSSAVSGQPSVTSQNLFNESNLNIPN